MLKIKVENLTSPRSGNPVPNQFTIIVERDVYFQSYETVIAHYNKDRDFVLLDPAWNYSRTTAKYLNQWLSEHFQVRDWSVDKIRKYISMGVFTIHELS